MAYATQDDWLTFNGIAAPPDLDRRLQQASDVLDLLLRSAVYTTDKATGQIPTDPVLAAGFRDLVLNLDAGWADLGGIGAALGFAGVTGAAIGRSYVTGKVAADLRYPNSVLPPAAKVLLESLFTSGKLRRWVIA